MRDGGASLWGCCPPPCSAYRSTTEGRREAGRDGEKEVSPNSKVRAPPPPQKRETSLPPFLPTCVNNNKSITSLGVVPGTLPLNPTMLSRNPSTIAFLCLATPTPLRYLLSALASAILIWTILSPSARSLAVVGCMCVWGGGVVC